MWKLVASAFLLAAALSTACSRTTSPELVLPALSLAIVDGTDSATVLQLISETPNVDVTDAIGATPLLYAAGLHKNDPGNGASGLSRATDDAILKALVDKGANVNAVTSNGRQSVLHVLIFHRRAAAVDYLLTHGANPNVHAGSMTPLMIASYRCYPEIVQLLLRAGADRDATDAAGFTARAHAQAQKCAAAIALL